MRLTQIVGISLELQVLIKRQILINILKAFNFVVYLDLLCDIFDDGTITCMPAAIISSMCKTDVTNFPFDEKNCHLTFGRYYLS